jgi:pimeloyl-ACP methyl ester carboxylesterase
MEQIEYQVSGPNDLPKLIYLPGLHGDWSLLSGFRANVYGSVQLIEMRYPNTRSWTINDYSNAIMKILFDINVNSGFILAESFGSQVAWALLANGYKPKAVILAGGFVRYPFISILKNVKLIFRAIPYSILRIMLKAYALISRLRYLNARENFDNMTEFLRLRTDENRLAACHRLELIKRCDFRDMISHTDIPIFYLSGFWDPIVPWPFVISWLKDNCNSFCASKILINADHLVLATAPKDSANLIINWIKHV